MSERRQRRHKEDKERDRPSTAAAASSSRLSSSFAQSVKSPPRVLRRRAAKEKLGGIFLTFFLRLSAFSYEIIRSRLSCLPALQHSSNDFEHFGEGGGGGERARDPFLLSVREYGSQRFLMSL